MAVLTLGAELLVKGAAAIAQRLSVEPLIIGLTVVAFGTSTPELAVSVGAELSGSPDIAFGNVVGSNIANILLILGASAAVRNLAVSQRIIRLDIPLLIGLSAVTLVMALNKKIGRLDGFILFAFIIGYTWWVIRESRREAAAMVEEYRASVEVLDRAVVERPFAVQIAYVVGGLVGLVLGSRLLVRSASDIATWAGISELVIGLTVVAVGTSLPELATSMMAAFRGQVDIAVGNVVGSCLFNLSAVLGATALVSSRGIGVSDASLRIDLPVMILATMVLVPILWNGFAIKRWEGYVLLAFYIGYVTYLILDASGHSAAAVVGPAILIVTPLVLLPLVVTGYQAWHRHRKNVASKTLSSP